MIAGIENSKLDMTIGIDYMPYRKKLCLVVQEGNVETKYATFNNDESAREFMLKLKKLLEMHIVNPEDWT